MGAKKKIKNLYYIDNNSVYWDAGDGFGDVGCKISDFIYYMEHVKTFTHDIRYKIYLEIRDQYPEYKI